MVSGLKVEDTAIEKDYVSQKGLLQEEGGGGGVMNGHNKGMVFNEIIILFA